MLVGAAVGTNTEDVERAKALIDKGCDLIVIGILHTVIAKVLKTLSRLKKSIQKYHLCGKYSNWRSCKKLYNSGADIIKVGIGPGSICTTRMVAGMEFH